ncbi:MAG TPA: hypothetical protein VF913_00255 [Xanthobacteraceae bacterium]
MEALECRRNGNQAGDERDRESRNSISPADRPDVHAANRPDQFAG